MINPVFAVTMLIGLALPMLPTDTELAERRLYWFGALVATASAFFVLYPPDWGGGLALGSAFGIGLTARAYFSRSYIRIRGRTYAFNLSDRDAEDTGGDTDYDPASDSYAGFATARKMWWLFAAMATVCAFIIAIYVIEGDGPWYAFGAAVATALTAVMAGIGDASWGYGVARGQWAPFAVAGIATLTGFILLYLLGYALGSRWPLRTKRSLEYRAHPHLRKKYP